MCAIAQRRMKFMKKLIATRQSLGDNALSHIHEVGYDLPEECLLALTDDMPIHMSYIYILYMIFDRFMSIPSDDVVNAFKHYKNYLKLMSFQNFERDEATTKRWMLKCPVHLFYTKEIAKAFPDCKFVWTHRHPVSAIPSMASLGKSLHQVYYTSDCRDDAGLGKAVKHCYENFLSRCADDLEASGRPTSHVTYNNLVKDPVQTVKDVYAQFNWAFTPEYEQILKNFLAEDAAKRENLKKQKSTSAANLHHYSPEEFSLTAEELSTGAFADYIKRFNIPMSKN